MILNAAEVGRVDAAINFWHFQAKMQAAGMREQCRSGRRRRSGAGPRPRFWAMCCATTGSPRTRRGRRFCRASREAKELLAKDDAAWDKLPSDHECRQRRRVSGAEGRLARRYSRARPGQCENA